MKTTSNELIADLIERTRQNLNKAEALKKLSPEELNFKSGPQAWSVLECIRHLNFYGEYYLPEIERRIRESRHAPKKILSLACSEIISRK